MALPLATTVLTAAAVAAASSLVLSARFPVGLARRLDPDRGVHADWLVLAAGLAALALLVLGGGALSARRGLVALLLGIPLGIAIGRVAWRWVAESTPLL